MFSEVLVVHLSPLRYPGGKSKISSNIAYIIRKNGFSNCYLLEAFCGGAGVGLNLLFSNTISTLILNDKDFGVASFWRYILEDVDSLLDNIENIKVNIEEWKLQKEVLVSGKNWRKIGFATLFLNRCNRSGILKGGCIGGIKQHGRYKIDDRFNKKDIIEKIRRIYKYRDVIKVYNYDIFDFWRYVVIPFYWTHKIFLYLDPPYWRQGKSLYREFFVKEQHIKLASILKNTKIPFVVSYDKELVIRNLYNFAKISTLDFNYSVNIKRSEKEYLILSKRLKD